MNETAALILDLDAPFRQTGRTTRMLKAAIKCARKGDYDAVFVCGMNFSCGRAIRDMAERLDSVWSKKIIYICPRNFLEMEGFKNFALFVDHAVHPEQAYEVGCWAKRRRAFIYR